jgi:hypothetical protein
MLDRTSHRALRDSLNFGMIMIVGCLTSATMSLELTSSVRLEGCGLRK